MSKRRVFFTDYGTLSPLGMDKKSFAKNLIEGNRCFQKLTDESYLKSGIHFLGLIPGQVLLPSTQTQSEVLFAQKKKWLKNLFTERKFEFDQIDLVVLINNTTPNNLSWVNSLENKSQDFTDNSFAYLQPNDFLSLFPNKDILEVIQLHNTCASVSAAVNYTGKRLALGINKKAIIIAFENTNNNALTVSALHGLKVLTNETESIEDAYCPFAKDRKGFVKADAIGFLVMECCGENSNIIAEYLGGSDSSDCSSLTDGIEDGSMVKKTMQDSLRNAEINISQVNFLNAHGSGTYLNDLIETRGINQLFGDKAGDLIVSSTKSFFGHALAATGVVEISSIFSMFEHRYIQSTLSIKEKMADANFQLLSSTQFNKRVDIVLKNSFGFGGYNSSLIIRNCL